MAGNWIIKCKKQSDYKLVKRALSSQDIPSKTKIKTTEDGTKKIKAIVVSKKHVDFADTIYFSLGDEVDFTLFEKEKGCKKEEVRLHYCEEMIDDAYEY
jgi:hypothetical protein